MKPIRLFGHPVHPPLVHLPMGALPLAFVADIVAIMDGSRQWWFIAFWLLVAGLCGAAVAATGGVLDYLALGDDERGDEERVVRTANRHLTLMIAAGTCFLVRLLMQHSPAGPGGANPVLLLCCSALGTILLLIGSWFGGDLVQGKSRNE
ncbi:MAG TPA: DUF2231 domain-containing protein [Candidatus Kapabacteria bacterium]|nr:DUF2231 domain-containing protein [Candidatus Kapabacteria bacterium]